MRTDAAGAYFVVPIPKSQSFTSASAIAHMSKHWKDRPLPPYDIEIYRCSVERDEVSGKPIGLVYTYERTEQR